MLDHDTPLGVRRACKLARSARFLSLRQTPSTMPKSVQAKEEEEVEEQTLNSPTDEDVAEEEFEIERILAYEPNRFISEQTKKVCGLHCDEFSIVRIWLESLCRREPSLRELKVPFKHLFARRHEFTRYLHLEDLL